MTYTTSFSASGIRAIARGLRFGFISATALTLASLQGCALFSTDYGYGHEELDQHASSWFNYDAARRGGFALTDKDGRKMVLSEPAPDAVASTALKLLAKASDGAQKLSGELNYEFSRTVAELAGRSQNVLVLREALFRLSELYVNGAFANEGDEVAGLYKETLVSLVEFAKTARIEASTKQAAEAKRQADSAMKEAEDLEQRERMLLRSMADIRRRSDELEERGGRVAIGMLRSHLPTESMEVIHGDPDAEIEATTALAILRKEQMRLVEDASNARRASEAMRARSRALLDASVAALRQQ